MDRRSFLAALAAPAAALLPGCGHGAQSAGTLRLAYETDFKSLDPAQCFDASTLQVMRILYGGLLDCDDDLKLVPWLAAEMPEVSADRLSYTFTIRQGVRFANGRELTADDFVYAIERIFEPATKSVGTTFLRNLRGAEPFGEARQRDAEEQGTGRRERLAEPRRLEGVRALDRCTLRIELEKPDLAFLWLLTLPYTYPVPREEVERHGEVFSRNPCGTGPFLLDEWQRGQRLGFGRNPMFQGPARPGLDRIEMLIGYDLMTQTMMFERGELDLLNIPLPDLVRLSRDPRWSPQVRSLLLQETDFLSMNCEMEPFTDPRVRQAVSYAVNRERIVQFTSGAGIPAQGLVPPGVFGHDPGRKGYGYDPGRAKRLLQEAGYPDGFAVELWYPTDVPHWGQICQVAQQDLKKVGIRANLKQVAESIFNEATARRRTVAFSMYGWTEDYPDASDFLGTLCDGSKIAEEECTNASFYNNEDVNELLHRAAVATDEAARADLYRRAEDLILEDAPVCVLIHPKEYRMCQPRVKGFTLHPMWFVRYENLWLERA
ncbi:MAG TPA: ABC transporter substrate-binding protein [Gemmataceae bacterium]|nr:ABC transporter substrate-binding protein [Gemmataceae bacterium]